MSYEKSENSGAHPEAPKNIQYAQEILNRPEVKKALEKNGATVYYSGINKDRDGNFAELTMVGIAWRKDGIAHGYPISFHQDHSEFVSQISRFFGIKTHEMQTKPRSWNSYRD